jgi:hypothetical protein
MHKPKVRALASATGVAVSRSLGLVGVSSAASAAPAPSRSATCSANWSAARSAISRSSCQSMPFEIRRVSGSRVRQVLMRRPIRRQPP